MAAVPSVVKYSHIHFGVWAGLSEAKKDGFAEHCRPRHRFRAKPLGLRHAHGAGHRHRHHSTATGLLPCGGRVPNLSICAKVKRRWWPDFGKSTVKATLTELATLEGSLSGYGFSGTKATIAASSADLNSSGTFKGEFSGGIYGSSGDEAAGVFAFDGGDAGAFNGAFGGTSKP